MASSKLVNAGYVKCLSGPDLVQYKKIVDLCEGIDPYELQHTDFTDDLSLVPDLNIVHISHYLVHKTRALNMSQMKSYKGTEAHNFLTSGFVLGVGLKKLPSGNMLCLGKVKHSQTLSASVKPLLPWVLILPNCDILTGWCTCVAGRSESCSHVGALLYAVELAASRKENSCTSRPNAWLPPAMREVPASEVRNIDFVTSHRKRRLLLDDDTDVDSPQDFATLVKNLPSKENLDSFIKGLHDSNASCALFRVLPEYKDEYAVKEPEGLPPKLNDLFDPKYFGLSREELKKIAPSFFNVCKITLEQRRLIEKSTRGQSSNHVWNLLKAGRIGGSTIYDALHTPIENPAITHIMKICYPFQPAFKSYWMKRGLKHEPLILRKYVERQVSNDHIDLQYRRSGFWIPLESPHIGASPDQLVRCKCCGPGLAEFKSLKNRPSGIDPKHMYQMQHQMFCIGNVNYCDYVVYVGNDEGVGSLDVTRVYPDKDMQDKIVKDSEIFFREVILLELMARYFSSLQTYRARQPLDSSDNAVDLVCYCRKPRQDPMIHCVGKNCYFEFYHLRCVQLTQSRKNWLCQLCAPLRH